MLKNKLTPTPLKDINGRVGFWFGAYVSIHVLSSFCTNKYSRGKMFLYNSLSIRLNKIIQALRNKRNKKTFFAKLIQSSINFQLLIILCRRAIFILFVYVTALKLPKALRSESTGDTPKNVNKSNFICQPRALTLYIDKSVCIIWRLRSKALNQEARL